MIRFEDLALDEGIALPVRVLMESGAETFESCQGGNGHCFQYPTIRFFGDKTEGYKAFDVLAKKGFRVICLQRVWPIENNEIGAPYWQLELAETGQPVEV